MTVISRAVLLAALAMLTAFPLPRASAQAPSPAPSERIERGGDDGVQPEARMPPHAPRSTNESPPGGADSSSRSAPFEQSIVGRFPLAVSTNGRYLVDHAGTPFQIRGDAAWSLIANLNSDEAEDYLDDRRAKGFNTLLVNLLEHRFAVSAPANRRGDAPFVTAGDFSTPNPNYFAFADQMIDLAAAKGFLVLLDVMYLGADGGDEGFWQELTNERNSREICFEYGRFLGEHFRDKSNVVFVIGGDFTPPAGSEGEARLGRIVAGVKAAGARQLWTGHWGSGLSTDVRALADQIDLQAAYPIGPNLVPDCGRAYARGRTLPTFLIEAGYEGESWKPGDEASIRYYEWTAFLGGCTAGVFYGHRDIWEFSTDSWSSGYSFGRGPWRAALDAPGAVAMQHMNELLSSLPWQTLAPNNTPSPSRLQRLLESASWYSLAPGSKTRPRLYVASGLPNIRAASRVIAAAADDGTLLMAYRPPTHSGGFAVDMTAMRGLTLARWWDPTAGVFSDGGVSLANAGVRWFEPPAANAAGAGDWVLILTSN